MIVKNRWLVVVAMLLLTPVLSFAGGSTCATATGLVPDGSVLDLDYVQANSTVWYSFNTMAGRSYSVVVRDDLDGNPGNDLQIAYYSSNCATQMTPVTVTPPTVPTYSSSQYRDTTAVEPKLVYGQRISIPAPSTDTIAIKVVNTNQTAGHYVSATVSETTLHSPQLNTYGSLNVWLNLYNSTSAPLTYTLKLVSVSCSPISPATTCTPQTVTDTTTLAANSTLGRNTATAPIAMNAQQLGYVILTHDGPMDAMQVHSILGNFGSLPYSMTTIPFGPIRGHR